MSKARRTGKALVKVTSDGILIDHAFVSKDLEACVSIMVSRFDAWKEDNKKDGTKVAAHMAEQLACQLEIAAAKLRS